MILDYSGEPKVITILLKSEKGRQRSRVRGDVIMEAEMQCEKDLTCPSLSIWRRGSISQETPAASRNWKKQGSGFSFRVSREEHSPVNTLILA